VPQISKVSVLIKQCVNVSFFDKNNG